MKFQLRDYYCGPATLQSACYLLGHKCPGQHAIAKLCGTTKKGTDEQEMIRGILALGLHADPAEYYHSAKLAWMDWLTHSLRGGWPMALCVDDWNHWVLAFAEVGGRVAVLDPANTETNIKRGGLRVYGREELARRVCASRATAGDKGHFYGIAIYSKNGYV